MRPLSIPAVFALLLLFARPAVSQVIALQDDRLQLTSIARDWRTHPGDDLQWAQPDFDASGWKLLQPAQEWNAQGFADQNGFAWSRVQLQVAPGTQSLGLILPGIARNYELFCNGVLVASVGLMPPHHVSRVTASSRLFTLPVHAGINTLALRLWQEEKYRTVRADVLQGPALVGSPSAIQRQFTLQKQSALLRRGSEYTQDVIAAVVGGATLILFLLTRDRYYLWFTLSLFAGIAALLVRVVTQHYGVSFTNAVLLYTAADFAGTAFFAAFLAGLLHLRSPRTLFSIILLMAIGELGVLALIFFSIPSVWANGIYVICSSAAEIWLIVLFLRRWRTGTFDIRLLLGPYALQFLTSTSSNLGYFLRDLRVPHAEQLITGDIVLSTVPFSITLADLGSIIELCGFLAVLVYRFALTTREQQRLASVLQAAHDLQRRLVPLNVPRFGGFHTEIAYLAAEEVGGDFCQVLPRGDGSYLAVIGDVSGKGLEAAMLGMLTVGALRSLASELLSPDQVLTRLNDVVLHTERGGFITCLCVTLSPAGEVALANAGHLAPYVNGQEVPLVSGLPLGLAPGVDYPLQRFLLPDKARMTLLSDGVVEARSRAGELLGFERTSRLSQQTAAEIAAAAHQHGQQDDITILTLDWQRPAVHQDGERNIAAA